MKRLFTQFANVVVGDTSGTCLQRVDMLVDNGVLVELGPGLADKYPDVDVVACSGLTAYPGLVNTHHHYFQAFIRNLAPLDWTSLTLMQWLAAIYPIFSLVDEDCIYHSSLVSMADLIKHGCTTSFDHQYNYSRRAGTRLVDRQFEAAQLLGMRFHAGRGCNTLPRSEGSTIPDAMLESTDEFLRDCERLISAYHDGAPYAMQRVVVAPCQPINAYPETFVEAARLARDKGVLLHTHLGEGENEGMQARFGMRSLEWCESIDFVGPDVWHAHGWELTNGEIRRMAEHDTGLSHCPAPVFLVGAEVTNIPALVDAGVRLGLGVDGQASNDSSNLAECIRLAYLLQCLTAATREHRVPSPYAFLRMASQGGADCLNRPELGSLAVGQAADFFCVDLDQLEHVGARHDPLSLPAKVGLAGPVTMTVINGRPVWRNGEFPGLDEQQMLADAEAVFHGVIYESSAVTALVNAKTL